MKNNFDILHEFKNSDIVQKEIKKIYKILEKIDRDLYLMEVCGTHTMQISKFGFRKILPKKLKLISGPGCPVCVTPQEYIDKAIYILENYNNVILTTFGDLYRVPGSESSLEQQKAKGKDIRVIYSVDENLSIALENKDKIVVFLSIGFETTMPSIACVVKEAKKRNIKNLYFLLGNKFFLPAMEVLILMSRKFLPVYIEEKSSIDGFILPGHLTAIIGVKSYLWISEKYKIPGVITGFEPVDIAVSIKMLLEMILENKPEIKNEYTRVVSYEGNKFAQQVINEVFAPTTGTWRGIGTVPNSGVRFTQNYEDLDAEKYFEIPQIVSVQKTDGCRCAEVIIGKITPTECPLFAKFCTPEYPKGACMVSQEGSCAAYYKYERF